MLLGARSVQAVAAGCFVVVFIIHAVLSFGDSEPARVYNGNDSCTVSDTAGGLTITKISWGNFDQRDISSVPWWRRAFYVLDLQRIECTGPEPSPRVGIGRPGGEYLAHPARDEDVGGIDPVGLCVICEKKPGSVYGQAVFKFKGAWLLNSLSALAATVAFLVSLRQLMGSSRE